MNRLNVLVRNLTAANDSYSKAVLLIGVHV